MTRDATLAMKGMDPAAPQAGPLAGPLAGQAGEDQQQASSESASSDDMANRLMRVSQLFGLSENKRNTLEQRAMKDVMMAGGAGGFGDMGALMDMLNPGGSQGDIPMGNMKNFMDGKMDAPLPDFSNMDPKEVAKIAGDLMAQVGGRSLRVSVSPYLSLFPSLSPSLLYLLFIYSPCLPPSIPFTHPSLAPFLPFSHNPDLTLSTRPGIHPLTYPDILASPLSLSACTVSNAPISLSVYVDLT